MMISYNYQVTADKLLMPMCKSLEPKEGVFRLHRGNSFSCDPVFQDIQPLVESLLHLNMGGEDILLGTATKGLSSEGYTLKVTKDQIVARAVTSKGMLNAVQTLRQMALANDNIIPCCVIEDEPQYRWRGFMLDCSRHFFNVQEIKKLLDSASLHHLNVFHWHLCDDQGWRFPVEGYPLLEEIASKRKDRDYTDGRIYGGFYSKEDLLEVQRYAHERKMIVVPEIETPGHSSALLAAYPNLGCSGGPYEVKAQWGIFEDVLCPGNDDSLVFLKAAITTLASIFTDDYIHIGGDECPHTRWEQCPKCQKRMQEENIANTAGLQGWFTSKVADMVKLAGKCCIGWDEVLEAPFLPDNLIVMSWRGAKGGFEASSKGKEVIMCPNTEGLYLDYQHTDDPQEPGDLGVATIKETASFSPIKKEMDAQQKKLILGAQGNLWTEKICFGRQAEYMLYPRLAVIAERLWQPQSYESVQARLEWEYKKLEKLDINCYRGKTE